MHVYIELDLIDRVQVTCVTCGVGLGSGPYGPGLDEAKEIHEGKNIGNSLAGTQTPLTL